jgi:hypothetical protein
MKKQREVKPEILEVLSWLDQIANSGTAKDRDKSLRLANYVYQLFVVANESIQFRNN